MGRRLPYVFMKAATWRKVLKPAAAATLARDLATDLAGWPRDRSTGANTYLTARYLHVLTSGRSSSLALAAARTLPFSPHRLPSSPPALKADWMEALSVLERDGITFLPNLLDAAGVERLVAFARTAPATLSDANRTSSRATYAERGPDTKSARIVEHFVLNNPDVQHVIASPEPLALAEAYFRTRVLVHPPQLYWSCAPPQSDQDVTSQGAQAPLQSAEEFHWDYDGLGGLRLHMYLTDVDEGSAPMKYMKRSHRPGTLQSSSLRNADRGVRDEEVWRRFTPEDAMTITGPAGTTFISNSNGLHRGTPARTRDRLFLVMPFQATSFAGYQLRPRTVIPKDPEFTRLLACDAPAMRWFTASPEKRNGSSPR